MATIQQVAIPVIETFRTGWDIYKKVAAFMDVMQEKGGRGESKKEWVLTMARDFLLEIGKNPLEWLEHISAFIDAIKATWRAVRGLVK